MDSFHDDDPQPSRCSGRASSAALRRGRSAGFRERHQWGQTLGAQACNPECAYRLVVVRATLRACRFLPSRPGELRPEPLTDPDLILSHHPARAIARRLPPSTERRAPPGEPVGPNQRRWPTPFAPAPLQGLRRYYEAVRPSPARRYFRPRGWSRLRLFPWHRRPGSHVPYQSLVEVRAAYTPDVARSVSGHPPS
jgi:hypothetical protein